jgi:hypothetical protein
MLAFFAALVITLAAVGWYLDWYKVRSSPSPTGKRSVTIDINTVKIGSDLHKAEQGLEKKMEKKAAPGKPEEGGEDFFDPEGER